MNITSLLLKLMKTFPAFHVWVKQIKFLHFYVFLPINEPAMAVCPFRKRIKFVYSWYGTVVDIPIPMSAATGCVTCPARHARGNRGSMPEKNKKSKWKVQFNLHFFK